MNIFSKLIERVDKFQQRHSFLAFPFAVFKHFSEDAGAYQAALLTYYGFLSMFPLLLVFTSATRLLFQNNPELQIKVAKSVSYYVPVVGDDIINNLQSPNKAGLALAVSLLITFYGAQGVAAAFMYVSNTLWDIPRKKWPMFPKNLINRMGIMIVGGLGLVSASVAASYVADLGHNVLFSIFAVAFSVALVWLTFIAIFKLALAIGLPTKDIILSSGVAAVGITILQLLGSFILHYQAEHSNRAYGIFSMVLLIIFWIYAISQVVVYSIEVTVVRRRKLYPRSFSNDQVVG